MKAFWDIVALAILAGTLGVVPRAGYAQDNATCLVCHSSPEMFRGREDADRLVVKEEELAGSVHGALGLSCVDCHQSLAGSDFPHKAVVEPVDCGACHGAVARVFATSVHGYAVARGNPKAPTCVSCHGSHDILSSSDPRSRTHKVRLPETCATCHGAAGLLTDQLVKLPQPFTSYAQSVHGRGVARGVAVAASCADCHGVHDLKGPLDPGSRINKLNVAATCGQCHPDVELRYEGSIHGRALKTGVTDSPTCIDCHGEHLILSAETPESRTCPKRLGQDICGRCHNDPVINAKYNLRGNVVGSYEDSYHGWAARRGCESAATCVSCHTTHSILPAADSASSVNPANVMATCGQCHEGADAKFVASYSHESTALATNPITSTIRTIYIWLIALIIGGMVLHNLLIMNYFMIERRKAEEHSRTILRFDYIQLSQHFLTTIAFIMLVITGFALRFPEAWWVEGLVKIGLTEPLRRDLHRIFAVVLILTAIYHVIYIFLTRRGRQEFESIVPKWQDLKDLVDNVSYYTWRRGKKVRFGRYDYTQKAEYWALVWGTILMIVTGFILWFPLWAVKILPSWIVPVAQTIHYYEAWLATLAILVWHFFFVIFHPEEYPMNWAWLTGRMSEESVKRHHSGWYDELTHGGQEDSRPES